MARANTNSKKAALTTKDNGGTTKWKERVKHILEKALLNIQGNGSLTNITAGEC